MSDAQANYYWASPQPNCTNTNTTPLYKTQVVGTYLANALGLHDMHGNVKEWCSDWYDAAYPTTAQTNPTGPRSAFFVAAVGLPMLCIAVLLPADA